MQASCDGNNDFIDVLPSWFDTRDEEQVDSALSFFDQLWQDTDSGVAVHQFPANMREILQHMTRGADWEKLLDEVKVVETASMRVELSMYF